MSGLGSAIWKSFVNCLFEDCFCRTGGGEEEHTWPLHLLGSYLGTFFSAFPSCLLLLSFHPSLLSRKETSWISKDQERWLILKSNLSVQKGPGFPKYWVSVRWQFHHFILHQNQESHKVTLFLDTLGHVWEAGWSQTEGRETATGFRRFLIELITLWLVGTVPSKGFIYPIVRN